MLKHKSSSKVIFFEMSAPASSVFCVNSTFGSADSFGSLNSVFFFFAFILRPVFCSLAFFGLIYGVESLLTGTYSTSSSVVISGTFSVEIFEF